ncbi:MAG: energy-coupling factor transporter transmembrane component T [Thermocladium sp.]
MSAITSLSYSPGNTVLHRASIWGKLIILIAIIIGLLINYRTFIASIIIISALTVISGQVRRLIILLKYLAPIILATIALYGISVLLNGYSSISISASLFYIALNSIKLIASLSFVVTIINTTNPRHAEALLYRLGFTDLALVLHLVIRMIPVISSEIENIRISTRLRGSGSSSIKFLIPVIANSLFRARDLADAITLRGARALNVPSPNRIDAALALPVLLILILLA